MVHIRSVREKGKSVDEKVRLNPVVGVDMPQRYWLNSMGDDKLARGTPFFIFRLEDEELRNSK